MKVVGAIFLMVLLGLKPLISDQFFFFVLVSVNAVRGEALLVSLFLFASW